MPVQAQNRVPQYRSPEVHDDRRVTFRIHAPDATDVTIRGEWMKEAGRTALAKADDGLWSITVGPLAPEMYYYTLYVHGVAVVDPRNSLIKTGNRGPQSLVDVPGPGVEFHALKPVAHGVLHVQWYVSKATKAHRRLHVYTPPGYDASKSAKYPVLYLLHGSGDADDGWPGIGRANWILDNLIAEGKAKAMLIVMPDGHATDPDAERTVRASNTSLFETDLMDSIIPIIEANYRVAAGSQNRALAGLSMGGSQTLHIGFNHPDKFSYLGVYSSGGSTVEIPTGENLNRKLRLFWIGCGTADGAIKSAKALSERLKERNVRHVFRETEGAGHQWPLWRAYLHEFAPQLFGKTS